MHKLPRRILLTTTGLVVGLGLASSAFGLPWDVDMADSQAKDGYSIVMPGLPEGTVAQPSILSPMGYRQKLALGPGGLDTPEIDALANPVDVNEKSLEVGERMYDVYCTPCHGDGQNLGPVAAPGRYPGVAMLAGNAGVLGMRSDGSVYTTITQGRRIMPYYGWAMDDTEVWSLVNYLRTMPGAEYTPPEPQPSVAVNDGGAR